MQLAVLLVIVSGYNDFGGFGYSVCICASRLVDWFVLKQKENRNISLLESVMEVVICSAVVGRISR